MLCPLDLIDGLELAQVGIGGMLEVTASSTRAAVVNAGHQVAFCRQVLVPKVSGPPQELSTFCDPGPPYT